MLDEDEDVDEEEEDACCERAHSVYIFGGQKKKCTKHVKKK